MASGDHPASKPRARGARAHEGGTHAHALRRPLAGLLRDTQRALQEVADILHIDPDVPAAVQEINRQASRPIALVILGTSAAARARLLHCLLGRKLLPDNPPRGCKWLRVQHGASTQVHLTLGNSEFELVEELECNKRRWDTLPVKDLIRVDHTDLTTMLEVELNIPFLKHDLCIIIPPDIETDVPSDVNLQTLKQIYSEFYSRRDLILRNFNPVYLCAIDRIGKNIFSDNFVPSIGKTRSEEDFWNLFNLYNMSKSTDGDGECDGDNGVGDRESGKCDETAEARPWQESRGDPVFNTEACLDLHQAKDINAHAQMLFVLMADSRPVREGSRTDEATESTEDVWCAAEDLPESDQELARDGVMSELHRKAGQFGRQFLSAIKHVRHTQESPQEKNNMTDPRRLKEKQMAFMSELLDQWELVSPPPRKHSAKSQWVIADDSEAEARAQRPEPQAPRGRLAASVLKFVSECRQAFVLQYCTRLSEIQLKQLQQFILESFDKARELQVVPRKIQYVATQEKQLYEAIYEKFSGGEKKQELLHIMQEVLEELKNDINNMDWSVDDLPFHQDPRFCVSNSAFYPWKPDRNPLAGVARLFNTSGKSDLSDASALSASDPSGVSDVSAALSEGVEAVSCDYNFDDYDIILNENNSNSDSFRTKPECETAELPSQAGSIRIENELDMSSLWSALARLDAAVSASSVSASTVCTNANNISLKQASLDVQQTVLSKLSRMISLKLAEFLGCLQENYFGTLERCLESLESSCRQELGGRPASEAMRQLLSVARQVDLQPCASFSFLSSMLESLRRVFYKLVPARGSRAACCALSPAWRRAVARAAAAELAPPRLARLISAQILERLREAHERYQSALTTLETALSYRLHHAQDTKLAIRKIYAPSFARLCLESTSLCDLLLHGTPQLGREIGRGQYGVVYAVKGGWGGHSPVAVKSVLPADKRHYNELAMEFFYTRSIPAHPRIVRLYGSLVQRHSGAGPSVLLVTERRARDLHCAVCQGLSFSASMRICCDIVEGIRYLHSFGLVHRDIKMKNVLLDAMDRAALSDLGFCAAEALITGSVVGTPVHMAPELLDRNYDAAVDVYAFGILFWYVCAGNTKLPMAFQLCLNKEQLWKGVTKGLRPERLPHFSAECWDIMQACWATDPAERAHLGDVQPRLERLYQEALHSDFDYQPSPEDNTDFNSFSDDDSYITGTDQQYPILL